MIKAIAVGAGVLVTLFVGRWCGDFLQRSVTVPFPERFAGFKRAEAEGGGSQLGIIERLLFFTAFWLQSPALAAGWLALKGAAKWASWQHVTKIPEGDPQDDSYQLDKRFLSSRLLGRFLNGTAYNVICGAIGAGAAQLVLLPPYPIYEFLLNDYSRLGLAVLLNGLALRWVYRDLFRE